MRHDLTDTDVLTFALAGCNANEIGTYAGTSPAVAQARINRVLREYCSSGQPAVIHGNSEEKGVRHGDL